MKKRKTKFMIGQPVLVDLNQRVVAGYDGDKRRVRRQIEWNKGRRDYANQPERGVITGMKQLWEGEYQAASQPGSSYFGYEHEYEQPYCSQDKEVLVWCVRLGYLNKELYFFEGDINVNGEIHEFFKQHRCFPMSTVDSIPKKWVGGYTKQYIEMIRRESKDWPRDEKGRWSK